MTVDPKIIARAAEMWALGRTARDIGDELGMTRNAVLGLAFRNRGIFPKSGKKATKVTPEATLVIIDGLYGEGASMAAIGEAIGRGTATAQYIIARRPDRYPPRRRSAKPKAEPRPKADPAVQVARAPVCQMHLARADAFRPLPMVAPVLLCDAPASACRWPVSTAPDPINAVSLHCCGGRATVGRYCAHHAALSVGAGTSDERGAHKVLLKLGRAA